MRHLRDRETMLTLGLVLVAAFLLGGALAWAG